MFARRRIRQLEAEAKVLREAVDWYAVNDNWKRRGIHPRGTPVRWEMSPAQKDHGGRAREAQVKADAIRRGPFAQLLSDIRGVFESRSNKRAVETTIAEAAEHLRVRVTVPQPLLSRDFSD